MGVLNDEQQSIPPGRLRYPAATAPDATAGQQSRV